MIRQLFPAILPAMLLSPVLPAAAQTGPLDVLVYVECQVGTGEPAKSSGVLVSAEGLVLTAKHAVPEGSTCVGKIGIADPRNAEPMIVVPTLIPADLAVLQFERSDTYAFVPFCPVERWMVGRDIVLAGFPGEDSVAAPSFRKGVLSTVRPDARELLTTDGESVKGMSGGPVFSPGYGGFLGIISEGQISPGTGTRLASGFVSVARFANQLGLTQSPRPCYHEFPEEPFANGGNEWRSGEPSIVLDVTETEGFCFLSVVFGQFNHPKDRVEVRPEDGRFVITGNNEGGATHGGRARCLYFD
jgi:Trypsin-like peptidase domain